VPQRVQAGIFSHDDRLAVFIDQRSPMRVLGANGDARLDQRRMQTSQDEIGMPFHVALAVGEDKPELAVLLGAFELPFT
jgi:hypothetical protein